MKVKFINRNTILMNAKDNFAVVKWMMENDEDPHYSNDVNVYMKAYARKKELLDAVIIRHDYVDEFVADLAANNIIEILK